MLVDLHGVQAAGWQLPRGTAAWGRTRFARLFCSSPPNVKKPAPKLPSPPGSFVLSNVFPRAPPEQQPQNITYDTPCHRLPSDGEISANYFVGAEGIPPQGLAGAAALSTSRQSPPPSIVPPPTPPPGIHAAVHRATPWRRVDPPPGGAPRAVCRGAGGGEPRLPDADRASAEGQGPGGVASCVNSNPTPPATKIALTVPLLFVLCQQRHLRALSKSEHIYFSKFIHCYCLNSIIHFKLLFTL